MIVVSEYYQLGQYGICESRYKRGLESFGIIGLVSYIFVGFR